MQQPDTRSVLTRLRALPQGNISTTTGQRAHAERQAALLRYLTASSVEPIEHLVGQMPRITVQAGEIPTSGLSHWDGRQWVITVNMFEARTRQRFTVLHEFKHIIDHPERAALYRDRSDMTAPVQAEQAADYFAGCALVPRPLLVDAWNAGEHRPEALARLFDVSVPAIHVRLMQIGLHRDRPRCNPPLQLAPARAPTDSERFAA